LYKNVAEIECQGQRSKAKVTTDKNALSATDTPGCERMAWARCKQRAAAVDGPILWLPEGVFQRLRAVYVW